MRWSLFALIPMTFSLGCSTPCETDAECEKVEYCSLDEKCEEIPAFPDDFLWGTAVAGFQVDYGCPTMERERCEDTASDWFAFTTSEETVDSPGAFLSGDNPSELGPGFWELYDADFERAATELKNNSFRMSIEWSRIFPEATDDATTHEELMALANQTNVEHYRSMFASMKAKGLTPMVTLNHYALPTWIHDPVACHTSFSTCERRGWVDSERTVREIAKFSGFVAKEYGASIDLWATLNEPLQNMLFGYFQPSASRSHPPAVQLQSEAARTVLFALVEAHARMVDAVRANDTVDADGDGNATSIGVVYPLVPISPMRPGDPADEGAAENISYLWNKAFLRATALGELDENLDGNSVRKESLVGRMDWIGVNWYFGITVEGAPNSFMPDFSPLLNVNPLTFVEGVNEPDKLEGLLGWVQDELKLPIYISENGAQDDPNDPDHMSRFVVQNLDALQRAIARGIDVRGYYYWTFVDNFEWNHGMSWKMGMYGMDGTDPAKTRTLRTAGTLYGEIASQGQIPAAAREKHLP
jgi:beta-glucosidase/6-phospho-beta-glucosidase/beta-galactosidase